MRPGVSQYNVRVHRSKVFVIRSSYCALTLAHSMFTVQKLDLQKVNTDDSETVRGQIVISLISRDRGGGNDVTSVSDIQDVIPRDESELPEG